MTDVVRAAQSGPATLVADPTQFDVIVANNSYGDVLSELSAAVAGDPGFAGAANITADVRGVPGTREAGQAIRAER